MPSLVFASVPDICFVIASYCLSFVFDLSVSEIVECEGVSLCKAQLG